MRRRPVHPRHRVAPPRGPHLPLPRSRTWLAYPQGRHRPPHPVGLGAVLVGGGLGALHHKNLGLSEADRDRIGSELEGGRAAVGVLAPVSESSVVANKLTDLGGTTEAHDVSDEVLEEAHTAATADK
jgi:hypothetical protein